MPRVNMHRDKHEKLVKTILGAQGYVNKSDEEMARAIGLKCRQTYRSLITSPERLTLAQLEALGKSLNIPIDELRAGITY